MSSAQRYLLGDVLVDQGMITFLQLTEALTRQKVVKQRIGKILVDSNALAEADLAMALARQAAFNRAASSTGAQAIPASGSPLNLNFLSSRSSKLALLLLTAITLCIIVAIILSDTKHVQTVVLAKPQTPANSNEPIAETVVVPPIQVLSETVAASIETSAPVAPIMTLAESLSNNVPPVDTASTLSRLSSSSSTIASVKINESAQQKQLILTSPESFKSRVNREYLDDGWVHYVFKNTRIGDLQNELLLTADWLQASAFEQQANDVSWRFQLSEPGTAKYHELSRNDEYQLVIVVRTNS